MAQLKPARTPAWRRVISATILVACLSSATAQAQIIPLGVHGGWVAFGGAGDKGNAICGIMGGLGGQPAERFFAVKYQPNYMFLHIVQENWELLKGAEVRVVVQIDSALGQEFTAVAISKNTVEAALTGMRHPATGEPSATLLNNLMRAGRVLRVSFPDYSNPTWEFSLTGSNAAFDKLVICGSMIEATAAPRGQPQQTPTYRAPEMSAAQLLDRIEIAGTAWSALSASALDTALSTRP